jgi:hypothetical protein
MNKLILAAILAMFLTGCAASIKSTIMPNVKLTDYKTAYIQSISNDEFNLQSKIMSQLSKMGLQVIDKPKPDVPTNADMLVNYNFHGDWDFGYYLQAFQIKFLDAKTSAVLGIIDFDRHGNFGYGPEERIADAFNDFQRARGMK